MLFTQLSDLLHDKFGSFGVLSDGSARVTMLLVTSRGACAGENEAAYVVASSELNGMNKYPKNMLLFCPPGSEGAVLKKLTGSDTNAVVFSQEKLPEVLNFTQLVLNRSLRESDNYAFFLQMIVNGRDMSYVLSEAAKLCGGQLVVIDFSGKIYAHSTLSPDLLPEWQMFIKNGYCPAEFMQHCYDMLLKRTEISSRAYSYHCDEHDLYYMSSPILVNNYAHGYVFMLSREENTSPVAYDTIQIMSKVAADYIQRSAPELSSNTQLYRRLLIDILGGESKDAISERITSGKFPVPRRMRVILLKPLFFSGDGEILKTLGSKLSAIFHAAPPIQYKRSLLLVASAKVPPDENQEKAIAFLDELAESNHLQVGVSNDFENLQDLPRFYGQAREAVALAERMRIKKHVVFYSDMAFFSLVYHLSEGTHVRDFCHKALDTLRKYDIENGTELFETCKVYVETNCNQKETAEIMHTHRNTISYRKQMIQDITNVDFSNPNDLFQLNYSFKIYEYMSV